MDDYDFEPRFDMEPDPFFVLLVGAACGWIAALLAVLLLFPALGLSALAGHAVLIGSCLGGWVVGGAVVRFTRRARGR